MFYFRFISCLGFYNSLNFVFFIVVFNSYLKNICCLLYVLFNFFCKYFWYYDFGGKI